MSEARLRAVDEHDERGAADLTVEQLAAATGMTVRNIRNHQSRGLLPPPEVRARTGFYGPQHVERLRLIQQLQAEGLKLSAITKLIGEEGARADRLIDLRRVMTAPFATEAPEIATLAELDERFGPAENTRALAKAQKLGVLVPIGGDRFEVRSPALLRAAEEVTERGVPLSAALDVIEKVQRNAHATARAFVHLFLEHVWKPFDKAGQPGERWPEITESIERLRPLASESLLAVFQQTMQDEVEEAFGKLLEQQVR